MCIHTYRNAEEQVGAEAEQRVFESLVEVWRELEEYGRRMLCLSTGETETGLWEQASQGYITGFCLNSNNNKKENNKVRAALCVNTPLVPALKGYKMRLCIKIYKQKKYLCKPINQPKNHIGVKEHRGRMGGMFMLGGKGIPGSFQGQDWMETKWTSWNAKATGKSGIAWAAQSAPEWCRLLSLGFITEVKGMHYYAWLSKQTFMLSSAVWVWSETHNLNMWVQSQYRWRIPYVAGHCSKEGTLETHGMSLRPHVQGIWDAYELPV